MAQDMTRLNNGRTPQPPRPDPGPPRELHPAAMQAAADYSKAIDEARNARCENDQLKVDLLAERQIRAHFESKLAAKELEYDALNRFVHEFINHIDTIEHALSMAKTRSIEVAKRAPPKPIDDLERDLAAAAEEVAAKAGAAP